MKAFAKSSSSALRVCRTRTICSAALGSHAPALANATVRGRVLIAGSRLQLSPSAAAYSTAAVKLTSETYPELKRGEYASVSIKCFYGFVVVARAGLTICLAH